MYLFKLIEVLFYFMLIFFVTSILFAGNVILLPMWATQISVDSLVYVLFCRFFKCRFAKIAYIFFFWWQWLALLRVRRGVL